LEVYVCEVCGRTVAGRPVRVRLDGYEATVCPSCARTLRGMEVKKWAKPRGGRAILRERTRLGAGVKPKPRAEGVKPKKSRRREVGEYELVEGYGEILRRAREELGLTVEHVAAAVHVKASLIRNIEAGKIVPSRRLARELEKLLEVKILVEHPGAEEALALQEEPGGPVRLTLGEIVQIKKKGGG